MNTKPANMISLAETVFAELVFAELVFSGKDRAGVLRKVFVICMPTSLMRKGLVSSAKACSRFLNTAWQHLMGLTAFDKHTVDVVGGCISVGSFKAAFLAADLATTTVIKGVIYLTNRSNVNRM